MSILIWMSMDGTYSSPMRAWPKTRLALEAFIDASAIGCIGVLGVIVKQKSDEGDWFTGFYATMMGLLGAAV